MSCMNMYAFYFEPKKVLKIKKKKTITLLPLSD